ncbi:alpha/beta hydrolase [Paludisphaera mucosa]|uniref:Alpha/beta hydrolase n=1 Tax=Paludisphaera mucosa TaxID=3030827 RepID=A0ABT6FIU6_9BACT|nr:alpha/beta hydrolase [Paludisphaera mucosa]MDG3007500.1 alpha/beta hydrolase [Paludisphaera mucosa]
MRTSVGRLLGALGLVLGLVAGAAAGEEPATKEFVYKTAPQGPLKVVVTYPPGWKATDARPGIVFFFGGGWTNGDVKQFAEQAEHLARRGMVAARADYRVKSRQGVTPAAGVEDAKSAVRWLRAHAREQGVDPDRIAAAGGSAGGHLAACTALTPGLDAAGEDLAVSSRPNALVLFNPVLRFTGAPELMRRIGDDAALGEAISPSRHVGKDAPPALILFGTADRLAPMGDEYVARARAAGARAELFTAEGAGHGFFNRPPWKVRTTDRMDEFLTSLGYLPRPD